MGRHESQGIDHTKHSFMLRWWWRLHKEPDAMITWVLTTLYLSTRNSNDSQIIFFWSQLHSIKLLFHFSTTYHIKNGESISFWYDPWCGPPLLQSIKPHPRLTGQRMSLRKAAIEVRTLLPHLRTQQHIEAATLLSQISFTEDHDRLVWM
jgi:hypothetical protein